MNPWRKSVMQGCAILSDACEYAEMDYGMGDWRREFASTLLTHAIRHLAYPDRDVYPKVRHGSKKHPVVKK